jgi:hypothetical protein
MEPPDVTNQDLSGVGADLYVGDPEAEQPNWRDNDPDNEISDDDDPAPIAPALLVEMLGFDPSEDEEGEEEEDETEEDDDES